MTMLMNARRPRIIFLAACALSLCDTELTLAESLGTVRDVAGGVANVAIESGSAPSVGDKAEIFFKLAGTEVSVATASVHKVSGKSVELKIENATGDVAKDQLVRIKSQSATARTTPPSSSSPRPIETPARQASRPASSSTSSQPMPLPTWQTKTLTPKFPDRTPAKSSRGAAEGEWTDLVNPSQKIIGTWQGGRHRTQYFADGTFVTDPHLVPDPPRGKWWVEGDRLIEHFPQAKVTTTHNIVSLSEKTLVIRNAQGQIFRKTRLSR